MNEQQQRQEQEQEQEQEQVVEAPLSHREHREEVVGPLKNADGRTQK